MQSAAGLSLKGLTKVFNHHRAVDAVDLEVPAGTFVCILGPSGCGKTTLLRMVAGLESPTAGQILLDGRDLTAVPTHQRDLGMVFQSLALFPHLDVGENIAYPLKIRGESRARQQARVEELLTLVQLLGMARRSVQQLSGGQRQRVAIARALATEPRLFLLDEPMSALDAKLREAMQVELRQLQQRLGITTLVVTHDQREAMSMADLVVVMGEGRVRQAASPMTVYREPADAFVADFIGQTNLLDLQPTAGGALWAGHTLPLAVERACRISIRPEDLQLTVAGAGHAQGQVRFIRDLGSTVEILLDLPQGAQLTVMCSAAARPELALGQAVGVHFDPARAVVLHA